MGMGVWISETFLTLIIYIIIIRLQALVMVSALTLVNSE